MKKKKKKKKKERERERRMVLPSGLLDRIEAKDDELASLQTPSFPPVDDDDVIALCRAMEGNTILTSVTLAGAKMGGTGARALASNTTLTTLNLSQSKIGDDGATALAGNTALVRLHLWRCGVGDAGAAALARNSTLKELHLSANLVDMAGATALGVQQHAGAPRPDVVRCRRCRRGGAGAPLHAEGAQLV